MAISSGLQRHRRRIPRLPMRHSRPSMTPLMPWPTTISCRRRWQLALHRERAGERMRRRVLERRGDHAAVHLGKVVVDHQHVT